MRSTKKSCPMCGSIIPTATNTCAACGEPLKMDRSTWPIFVRLSLGGLRTRRSAWGFLWICILVALASIAYGFFDSRFFLIGVVSAFTAMGYYLPLRWVDRNSRWRRQSAAACVRRQSSHDARPILIR